MAGTGDRFEMPAGSVQCHRHGSRRIGKDDLTVGHEATVSKVGEDQLFELPMESSIG